MKKKVMLVFGTRPEAIKMCPLVNELKTRESLQTIVCVTGQHRQMLDQVLNTFNVVPDYDLSIMKQGQTLFDITTGILEKIKAVLEEVKPDVAFVSNHGGRIKTREGSSAEFLSENFKMLKSNCDELWVDGGIRLWNDVYKGQSYGASEVLVGRPFASALCKKNSFDNILKN